MAPIPPPPPPPGGKAPSFDSLKSVKNEIAAIPNKSALLKSIQKGSSLKKTVTNDRSAPLVSTTNTPTSKPTSAAGNNSTSHESTQSGSGLGGLFANGFPKLRSTKDSSSTPNNSSSNNKSNPSTNTNTNTNTVRKSEPSSSSSIPAPPKKNINNTSNNIYNVPPPTQTPKYTTPKPVERASITKVTENTKKMSLRSPELERTSTPPPAPAKKRWIFPDNVEKFLPSPRKYTSCEKIYLSKTTIVKNTKSSDSSSSSSDSYVSEEDIECFINGLNMKMETAIENENFKECVRLKTKMKSLESIRAKIYAGKRVLTSDLPK